MSVYDKIMTREEIEAKSAIRYELAKKGYGPYSDLLKKFILHLTSDRNVVGYIIPDKGIITLNRDLDLDAACVVTIHEILHQVLNHSKLELEKLAEMGFASDEISSEEILNCKSPQELLDKLSDNSKSKFMLYHEISNIAADYDLGNRAYTAEMRTIAKSIILNGDIIEGLVARYDHPDWESLTFFELFDAVAKDLEDAKEDAQKSIDKNSKIGDRGDEQIEEAEQLDREAQILKDKLDKIRKDLENSESSSSNSSENNDLLKKVSDLIKTIEDKLSELRKIIAEITTSSGGMNASSELSSDKNQSSSDGNTDTQNKSMKSYAGNDANSSTLGKIMSDVRDLIAKNKIVDDELSEDDTKELEAAIVEIKKVLSSSDLADIATLKKSLEDRKQQALNNLDKVNAKNIPAQNLSEFKNSLLKFIKNQISDNYNIEQTYRVPNSSYSRSNIIMPKNILTKGKIKIPRINFYYDRSPSCRNEYSESIEAAGISVLSELINKNKLAVSQYKFASNVEDISTKKFNPLGTLGQPILKHIEDTKPDNVVIITDSDITDCVSKVIVPGGVWLLFIDGNQSLNLIEHIKGKKITEVYNLIL